MCIVLQVVLKGTKTRNRPAVPVPPGKALSRVYVAFAREFLKWVVSLRFGYEGHGRFEEQMFLGR